MSKETIKYPLWFYAIALSIPLLMIFLLEFSLRQFDYGKDYKVFTELSESYPGYLFLNPGITSKYFLNIETLPSVIADGFKKEKSKNCFRVFVLGGSSTAGWPYVPNASFSRYIKRRLQIEFPSTEIEVINLGMSAVNSFTILDLIDDVLEQSPDLICIYAGHNEYYGVYGAASTQSFGSSIFLKNLIIRLQDFREVQLIQNVIKAATKLFSSEEKKNQNETLMTRMIGENLIPFGSPLYKDGIEQFETNFSLILKKISEKNIPTLIGTLASNLKDLKPFKSVEFEKLSTAEDLFSEGEKYYQRGDFKRAKEMFTLAKDYDAIRFRAPSEINEKIISLASRYSVDVVNIDSAINEQSENGIVGNNLMVDHLHLTTLGYQLIGREFFRTMQKKNYLPQKKNIDAVEKTLDSLSFASLVFTPLDSTIADLRIRILKGGFPFVPKGEPNKLIKEYKPKYFIDTLAMFVIDRIITWEKAHYDAASYYLSVNDYQSAMREFDALIADRPMNTAPYQQAATVLIDLKLYNEAKKYLEQLNNLSPGFFAHKWLGAIALNNNQLETALHHLESATSYSQTDPQVYYNLAGAYYKASQIDKSFNAIKKCLQLNPQNQIAQKFYYQLLAAFGER